MGAKMGKKSELPILMQIIAFIWVMRDQKLRIDKQLAGY